MTVPEGAPALPDGHGQVSLHRRRADVRRRRTGRRCTTSTSRSTAGETVALVGAMGSGKTALVSLLPRLYDVSAGQRHDRRRRRPRGRSRPACARRSRSSPTTRSCSPRPSTTTSPTRAPTPRREEVERAARGRPGRRVHRGPAEGLRHADRRARADAVGRPAPADRDRPRGPRRPAHPDPRRRDLVGRRLDRAGDQARAARGDGRADDVRRSPTASRRSRSPTRSSCSSDGTVAARGTHDELLERSPLYREIVEKGMPDQVFLTASRSRRRWRAVSRVDRYPPPAARDLRAQAQAARPGRAARALPWRVLAMFVSLVAATAAALAPAPLAKLAIDDGIQRHDVGALDLIVVAFLASAVVYAVASYAQTYLVGWVGQRALQDLRMQLFSHLQRLSIGFYSRNRAGVIISRLTNDVEALDQLVEDGLATLIQSGLTLIGVVVILFVLDAAPGAADVPRAADPGGRRARVPDRLRRRLPADAREDRVDHGLPPGDAVGHPRRARVRAGAAPHRALRGAQRREPRGEHDDRQAERGLLPGGRVPVGAGHGRDPR